MLKTLILEKIKKLFSSQEPSDQKRIASSAFVRLHWYCSGVTAYMHITLPFVLGLNEVILRQKHMKHDSHHPCAAG